MLLAFIERYQGFVIAGAVILLGGLLIILTRQADSNKQATLKPSQPSKVAPQDSQDLKTLQNRA